jgi:hypothetical protein
VRLSMKTLLFRLVTRQTDYCSEYYLNGSFSDAGQEYRESNRSSA